MKHSYWLVPALLCVAAAAAAASLAHKSGSESWSAVAGKDAAQTQTALVRSRYHALRGIKVWDYDRRSCVIEVEQSSVNTPSRAVAATVRACEPRVAQSWKAADVGDGRLVTAIETCTATGENASAAIRGVRLWGAGVGEDGKVEKPSADVKLELSGCKKWSGKVACPEGTVATGIRTRLADQKEGIVGLELRCHELAADAPKDSQQRD
jgi:hypothetical protein